MHFTHIKNTTVATKHVEICINSRYFVEYFVEKCPIFRNYDQYSSMCCHDNRYDRDIIFALIKRKIHLLHELI